MDPQIANHTWTDSANTSEVCRLYGNPSPKSPQVSPPPGAVATQIAGLAAAAKAVGNLSVASYVQVRIDCSGCINQSVPCRLVTSKGWVYVRCS